MLGGGGRRAARPDAMTDSTRSTGRKPGADQTKLTTARAASSWAPIDVASSTIASTSSASGPAPSKARAVKRLMRALTLAKTSPT